MSRGRGSRSPRASRGNPRRIPGRSPRVRVRPRARAPQAALRCRPPSQRAPPTRDWNSTTIARAPARASRRPVARSPGSDRRRDRRHRHCAAGCRGRRTAGDRRSAPRRWPRRAPRHDPLPRARARRAQRGLRRPACDRGLHAVGDRCGGRRGVLRIKRQHDEPADSGSAKESSASDGRTAVGHADGNCRRGRDRCVQAPFDRLCERPRVDQERRARIGPDLAIGASAPRRTERQHSRRAAAATKAGGED